MTPKEKAEELVHKFTVAKGNHFFSIDCALVAVDEILKEVENEEGKKWKRWYWQEVKKEIEKL